MFSILVIVAVFGRVSKETTESSHMSLISWYTCKQVDFRCSVVEVKEDSGSEGVSRVS